MSQRRAFTLIELLVVVAIIVALLAILLPSMGKAIQRAEEAICASDIRSLAQTTLNYAADYKGALPDLTLRPGAGAIATNVYWTWPEWREIFEDTYGIQRQNWFSVSNASWQGDNLYYWGWNGSDPDTATHLVMGRFYFASTKGNGDFFYNGMLNPPTADKRPMFPQRLADRGYFDVIWADLNREYPDVPGVIDWSLAGAERIGANHLYGSSVNEMPEGTHLGRLDGSVQWTPGSDMIKRSVLSSAALWW